MQPMNMGKSNIFYPAQPTPLQEDETGWMTFTGEAQCFALKVRRGHRGAAALGSRLTLSRGGGPKATGNPYKSDFEGVILYLAALHRSVPLAGGQVTTQTYR